MHEKITQFWLAEKGMQSSVTRVQTGNTSAFDKFTQQNLANNSGCVYTNISYFLYITSEVKQ